MLDLLAAGAFAVYAAKHAHDKYWERQRAKLGTPAEQLQRDLDRSAYFAEKKRKQEEDDDRWDRIHSIGKYRQQ